LEDRFGLAGRVAIVTGATGTLGRAISEALAGAGAAVAVLARSPERTAAFARELEGRSAGSLALSADVLDQGAVAAACAAVLERWGRVDVLVNAAGGNIAAATTGERTFFELPLEAIDEVMALNFKGTLLPSRIFAQAMLAAAPPEGGCAIVNISSMAAHRALTRVVGYAAAKAAVESFTRWLAVDLARARPGHVRVNAVAPGFFVADQNRSLLLEVDGTPTARGRTVIERTPSARFGVPEDLGATVVWLCGAGSAFVTGTVVPVDGGFDAFAGL
jgi:NAD(P)-dependent dehydrogenase (short-subunit alcohol dehydrogenase family)